MLKAVVIASMGAAVLGACDTAGMMACQKAQMSCMGMKEGEMPDPEAMPDMAKMCSCGVSSLDCMKKLSASCSADDAMKATLDASVVTGEAGMANCKCTASMASCMDMSAMLTPAGGDGPPDMTLFCKDVSGCTKKVGNAMKCIKDNMPAPKEGEDDMGGMGDMDASMMMLPLMCLKDGEGNKCMESLGGMGEAGPDTSQAGMDKLCSATGCVMKLMGAMKTMPGLQADIKTGASQMGLMCSPVMKDGDKWCYAELSKLGAGGEVVVDAGRRLLADASADASADMKFDETTLCSPCMKKAFPAMIAMGGMDEAAAAAATMSKQLCAKNVAGKVCGTAIQAFMDTAGKPPASFETDSEASPVTCSADSKKFIEDAVAAAGCCAKFPLAESADLLKACGVPMSSCASKAEVKKTFKLSNVKGASYATEAQKMALSASIKASICAKHGLLPADVTVTVTITGDSADVDVTMIPVDEDAVTLMEAVTLDASTISVEVADSSSFADGSGSSAATGDEDDSGAASFAPALVVSAALMAATLL